MDTNKKKTCSIALMSGKGGSGKTTLALSMASLLSSCDVKTLLIDCDLSTNGATYFFEEEMAYYVNNIDTLHELLKTEKKFEDIQLYPVNKAFDFLPSVTKIGEAWAEITLDQERKKYLDHLFDFISDRYEVVIYDCQAGYTEILETIIRMTDRNLMVLEADSVSASAVRNLFLKLNKVWNNKRIYQVFNKATKEEAEIYSKITSGTMFDNIGCILFDWTVRRAFSVSKIPDMINTSADYGKQVCDLCNSLIKNPDISQKLTSYTNTIRREELKSLKVDLNKKIKEIEKRNSLKDEAMRHDKKSKAMMYLNIPFAAFTVFLMTFLILLVLKKGVSYISQSFLGDMTSSILEAFIFILAGIAVFVANHIIEGAFSKRDHHMSYTSEDIELNILKKSLEKVQEDLRKLEESEHSIDKGNRKTTT